MKTMRSMIGILLVAVSATASFSASAQSFVEDNSARCVDLAKSTSDNFQRRLQAMVPGPVSPVYTAAGSSSFGSAINGILSNFGAPAMAKGFADAIIGAAQGAAPAAPKGFFEQIFNKAPAAPAPTQTPGFNPYQR